MTRIGTNRYVPPVYLPPVYANPLSETLSLGNLFILSRYHPDKHGGSNTAFQRITAAYDTLTDVKRKGEYDLGSELHRELQQDGSQGPDHEEKTIKEYFPERYGVSRNRYTRM